MSVIISNDGSQWQKPTALTTAGAIAAGSMAQGVMVSANDLCAYPIMGKMRNIGNGIDKVEIGNALKTALEKGGLKDKVEIINFSSTKDYKNIAQIFKDIFKNKSLNLYQKYTEMMHAPIKEGFNACFSPILNKVMINTEKIGLAGFHEIGHAMNFNNSKFWKSLHMCNALKVPSILMGLFTSIALLKRKKVDGEQPQGFFDKAATFIKENIGKLTLLGMVPVVAEEVKATMRGNKLAKEILSPENYKKVVKLNRYGATTYVGLALLMSGGAYLANKIKDSIAKPKKIS